MKTSDKAEIAKNVEIFDDLMNHIEDVLSEAVDNWIPVEELPKKLFKWKKMYLPFDLFLEKTIEMKVDSDILIAAQKFVYWDEAEMKKVLDITGNKHFNQVYIFNKKLAVSTLAGDSTNYGIDFSGSNDEVLLQMKSLIEENFAVYEKIVEVHKSSLPGFGFFIVAGNPEDVMPEDFKKNFCWVKLPDDLKFATQFLMKK